MVDYGQVLVRSLMFESNKRKYGPFGIQQGTHFLFPLSGGRVVGFHGRSSWNLDSIGFYLKPVLQRCPSNSLTPCQQTYAPPASTAVIRNDPTDHQLQINHLPVSVYICLYKAVIMDGYGIDFVVSFRWWLIVTQALSDQ